MNFSRCVTTEGSNARPYMISSFLMVYHHDISPRSALSARRATSDLVVIQHARSAVAALAARLVSTNASRSNKS